MVLIDLFLTIMVLGGARFAVRAYTERARTYGARRNTLIVGAGERGQRHHAGIEAELQPELQPDRFRGRRSEQEGRARSTGSRYLGSTDELHELISSYRCRLRS